MSKTLWYLFHPFATSESTNRKILETAKQMMPEVKFVDLSAGQTYNVEEEQKNMKEADTIVFQYPIFWFTKPHDLVEFQARTWTPGFCYMDGDALKGKQIITITTTGAPEAAYSKEGPLPYNIDETKNDWDASAAFVGAKTPKHFNIFDAPGSTQENIDTILSAVKKAISE